MARYSLRVASVAATLALVGVLVAAWGLRGLTPFEVTIQQLDPLTGEIIVGGTYRTTTRAVAGPELIYVVGPGGVTAVGLDGAKRWGYPVGGVTFARTSGDSVIVESGTDDDRAVVSLDAATGEKRWGRVGSLTDAMDGYVVVRRNQVTRVLDADSGAQIARLRKSESFVSSGVFALASGDTLILGRGDEIVEVALQENLPGIVGLTPELVLLVSRRLDGDGKILPGRVVTVRDGVSGRLQWSNHFQPFGGAELVEGTIVLRSAGLKYFDARTGSVTAAAPDVNSDPTRLGLFIDVGRVEVHLLRAHSEVTIAGVAYYRVGSDIVAVAADGTVAARYSGDRVRAANAQTAVIANGGEHFIVDLGTGEVVARPPGRSKGATAAVGGGNAAVATKRGLTIYASDGSGRMFLSTAVRVVAIDESRVVTYIIDEEARRDVSFYKAYNLITGDVVWEAELRQQSDHVLNGETLTMRKGKIELAVNLTTGEMTQRQIEQTERTTTSPVLLAFKGDQLAWSRSLIGANFEVLDNSLVLLTHRNVDG